MIAIQNFSNPGGRVSIVQHGKSQVPFDFKRVFWITGTYNESIRGQHAHKKCEQFIVATNGRCKADGMTKDGEKFFHNLISPACGLYVPPMTWLRLFDFSRETVVMVLASHEYDEADYIRDFDEYENLSKV